jgi:tight adherence protein C
MLLLIISAAITIFLLATFVLVAMSGREAVEVRLIEIGAGRDLKAADDEPRIGLAGLASGVTSFLKPLRDLIMANDEDLTYRLSMAGYRKPEHAEIYTAAKMLLPVLAVLAASFAGSNMIIYALLGGTIGFFGPDLVVTQKIKGRLDQIRHTLPDALDLLVICMEAGLGIDQALVRVGDEIRMTSPALADELLIINREQRAGKPRLEAWRSMSERVDIDYVRQFVTMLVQTERFGTPIAQALGQFADSLRMHRMHAAEEIAAKTGVKLLFPLVFFILPSVFVVVLLPALLHIVRSLNEFLK